MSSNKTFIWVHSFFICFIGLLIYSFGLKNSFVNYDDILFFIENEQLQSGNIIAFFEQQYKGHFQPFFWLICHSIIEIFGFSALIFKSFALFVHLINVILVYKILRMLLQSNQISFLLSLLFTLTPLNSEAVLWSSALGNLLSATFAFTSIIAFLYFLKSNNKLYYFVSILSFCIGFLIKSYVVFLPLSLLYLMKLESQSFWRNIKTLIPFLILAAVGVSIILKVSADFGSQTNVLMANMSTLERILLIPIFILYYPIKLIIPIHFSSPYFIPFENNLLAKLTALCLLVSLLFLLIKLWLKGNYSILLFGIVFYFIMMIPFLQFIPAFDNPIGDRFVYIGSIGLLITLGGILMRLNKILSQNWVYGIVGVLLLFSAFQTYQRTQVWNNSISLYSDCKEKWPNHPYPYYALGVEHTDLNHPQKAIDEFIASEKLGNQSYELYYYKALNYINAQDYLSATTNLELALQRKKTKEALMNLGNCNIILNRAQVAINNFNQALQLDEFYTKARKGRAHAALEIGDTISACEDWDELKEIQMLKKYCH